MQDQAEVDVAAELVDVASITDGKAIVRFSKTEAALAELRAKYKDARYDLTTVRGDTAARQARRELVTLRTGLDKRRKELKLPAVEFSRRIDSEAQRITGDIVALETPIDEQIKLDEQRRENDRLTKLRAEEDRTARHRQRIQDIDAVALRAVGLPSAEVQSKIQLVSRLVISNDYEEFWLQAVAAKAETLQRLQELHAAALVSEEAAAEALRNKERLAELERAEAERVAHEAKERREREASEEHARAVERKAAELRQRQSAVANELIAEIRVILHRGFTSSAAGLLELATLVEAISVGELGEFNDAAQKARDDALVQLHEMHLHVLQREAEKRASDIEQQRIRNEQAEAQRRIDDAAAEVARQQEAIAEQQRVKAPGTKTAWVDPDDAPELEDEFFERAVEPAAANEMTVVSVVRDFNSNEPIGELLIRTDVLPPLPDFVFTLGFRALDAPYAPGSIPNGPYSGAYELIAIAPVSDDSYIGYLRQIGKLPPASIEQVPDQISGLIPEFRQSTLSVEEVDSLVQQLADCRAALVDAIELLDGWITTKCPKTFVAKHMARVAKLRVLGGLTA